MITAVVVAYWEHRSASIPQIVSALQAQTMPPDSIIVFNNNKDNPLDDVPGASVINCGANFTSRSKYAAAMLIPSKYYLLLDDDVLPQAGVIENFMQYARPGCCLSDYGLLFKNNFFHQGVPYKGHEIKKPKPVNSFIGRTQFLSFSAIVRMFELESKVRLDDDEYLFDGEDILIGLANKSFVIPTGEGSHAPTIEGSQERSMQDDWGYHILRDMFAFKALQALGIRFEGASPGTEDDIRAANEYRETVRKRT